MSSQSFNGPVHGHHPGVGQPSGGLPAPQTSLAWLLGSQHLPAHVEADHTALLWGGQTRTYSELRTRALGLASGLLGDLRPGDRVATLLYNRGETFELYFACAFAGLTLVPINFRFVAREVALILEDSGSRMLISEPRLAAVARQAAHQVAGVRLVELEEEESGPDYEAIARSGELTDQVQPAGSHIILYTSGTTGRPKGVMLSPLSVLWFGFQQAALYPINQETVTLLVGPTYNTASINEMSVPTFLAGGTVAIHPSGGWSPRKMSDYIDRWRVTHSIVYPVMMEPMLTADREESMPLASLRLVLTGGENCPTATVARFRRRWTGVKVVIGYGLTEAGVATMIVDDEIERHPGSVGRPAGGQTVEIVDDHGRRLGPRETGEIITAGPSVCSGYWAAPELTSETIRDGWLWTGDRGWKDEEGYVYVVGRSKDMIISGAQNIYPAEIENVLSEMDSLMEFTVVGVPDSRWGEAVCVVAVPKAGAEVSEDAVIDFVRERLASYKKPRHVVLRSEPLPRNPSAKVLKHQLREEYRKLEQSRHASRSPEAT